MTTVPRVGAVIDFDGQVVIVTGAGRGLGRHYALDVARRGASVVVNDLGGTMLGEGADPGVADDVVAEIESAGGTAVASHDSVATPEGGAAIVQRALDTFGRVDAVIANAGIFAAVPFEDLTPDQWRQMRRVHLDGSFYLAQPAFRAMKAQGYGRFVFISSSSGVFGRAETAHYGAAKAGVVGLSNVVALEGAAHGIRSNNVLPYGITRMVTDTTDPAELDNPSSILGRIRPELVVPIVTYLASRTCAFTHQSFSAGAGWFGRAFIGLGQGWLAPDGHDPTADDLAEHLDEVAATEPHTIPRSLDDEAVHIARQLGLTRRR